MPKRDLKNMLSQQPGQEPEIVRGQGYKFSTENTVPPPEPEVKKPAIERQSVRIRKDLVKKCKRLAIDEDTTIAELIEAFIEAGLKNYM